MEIILFGNPNVGKSTLFNQLCGSNSATAHYPGTSVSILHGRMHCPNASCSHKNHTIIDAPGMYCLNQPKQALTQKTAATLAQARLIVNVIDATKLERNLYLATQLGKFETPRIVVLNVWDEAIANNLAIEPQKLSKILGAPVVPTSCISGEGIKELKQIITKYLHETISTHQNLSSAGGTLWEEAGRIAHRVQKRGASLPSWNQELDYYLIHPFWGSLIAIATLLLTLTVVSLVGEQIESGIAYTLDYTLSPFLLALHNALAATPFSQHLLIGTVHEGAINYAEAMGMLTSGLFIPIAKVAPVVILFYAVLGFLEDSGYLPRLAALTDVLMKKFSLHGFAAIPMILGAGCSVSGIVATRMLPSKKQRIITSALLATTIPCTSQTALIMSLRRHIGPYYVITIFGILLGLWYVIGRVFGICSTTNRPFILELPTLRMPTLRVMTKKLWLRIQNFFSDAIPFTLAGIFAVLLGTYSGFFLYIGTIIGEPLGAILGIRAECIPILIMGLFRKEIALSCLHALPTLSVQEWFTTTLLLAIYFPCISVYTIMYREFGMKMLTIIIACMFGLSTGLGILANLYFRLYS